MRHIALLGVLVVIVTTFAGCEAPVEDSNSFFSPPYVDGYVNFENLPNGEQSGTLRFGIEVKGRDGKMPMNLVTGERATHLWLVMWGEQLQEVIRIDGGETGWYGSMTLGDTVFEESHGNYFHRSISYGPAAVGDIVQFEIEMGIIDDLAFCCGRYDTTNYQILAPKTAGHEGLDHFVTIGAALMGPDLTRDNMTLAFHIGQANTFLSLSYNHRTGHFSFSRPWVWPTIEGYNSLP